MIARRKGLRVTIHLVAITCGIGAPVVSAREQAQPPSAAMRMQQPGHEEEQLRQRSGTWTVVSRFRPTPDATPIVSDGLMAERTMVGLYMREVMTPGQGARVPDFSRIAYQYFSRVEGRWPYVSLDTRFPVGAEALSEPLAIMALLGTRTQSPPARTPHARQVFASARPRATER